jgi:hypothetical protein
LEELAEYQKAGEDLEIPWELKQLLARLLENLKKGNLDR